jgi:hypothetical protein
MSARAALWPAYKQLLQRSTLPIIVGCFRGEVGFEALYFVPFLRALGIDPERLYIVTRAGAHVWYPNPRGIELFALRDPKQVRVENIKQVKQTGMLKQTAVSAFDRDVLKDAAGELKLTRYLTLHPSWMYHVLEPFWESRRGLSWLHQHVNLQSLPPPDVPGLTLPPAFVAVRFYARSTFPYGDVAATIAQETIRQLAAQQPVVLLNAPVHADEHVDFDVKDQPNLYRLKDLVTMTPQNNLAVQSAVLAKAVGFVGTYGGLAQLALLYKKPTVSFYQDWQGTLVAHKHLADAMAMQAGVACQVVRVTEIPLLRTVLPAISFSSSKASQGLQ